MEIETFSLHFWRKDWIISEHFYDTYGNFHSFFIFSILMTSLTVVTLYPVFRGGMLVTPYLSLYTWDMEVFGLVGLLEARGDLAGGGLLSGLTA